MILETMTPLDFMEFRSVNLKFSVFTSYCRKDVMNDAVETAMEK